MNTHILGAIMMRFEIMPADEFDRWLSDNYPDVVEQKKIKEEVIEQRKGKKYSYGKIY